MKTTRNTSRLLATLVVALLLALSLAGCEGFSGTPAAIGGASDSGSAAAADATPAGATDATTPAEDATSPTPPTWFDLAMVPPYTGNPSVEIGGSLTRFTEADRERGAFELYSPLDSLGRCGTAFALVGRETMPHASRGSIGEIRPSGWHYDRYEWVDGKYLFNRCHLIGWQLAGENANECNLITGTRSMNTQGMLPYEEQVAAYIRETGNHVLYRVTPVFESENLVASGVLMEAESLEDKGESLRFCVWCYNAEPGVSIDYATGVNKADGTMPAESNGTSGSVGAGAEGESPSGLDADQSAATDDAADEDDAASDASGASSAQDAPNRSAPAAGPLVFDSDVTYILNTNSHRFHTPDCPSVADMSAKNRQPFTGTREEAIELRYKPCGRCKP